jgi:hypothetical protein
VILIFSATEDADSTGQPDVEGTDGEEVRGGGCEPLRFGLVCWG